MNNHQKMVRNFFLQLAEKLHLKPYNLVESGNGTEFKNYLNKTIFTVYHERLDPKNQDHIEVAISIDNLMEEHGLSGEHAQEWLKNIQVNFPATNIKSPQFWPRIALWSMDAARAFEQDLRTLISSNSSALPSKTTPPIPAKEPTLEPVDEKTLRYINTRRGQSAFRCGLLAAYGSTCAISGCTDDAVLEAAHISPHAVAEDYRIENGLLLRADLHTLFDLQLISVNPQSGMVVVSSRLSSSYQTFSGHQLRRPISQDKYPDPVLLMKHFRSWQEREKGNN